MKKIILIGIISVAMGYEAHAQGVGGFFSQQADKAKLMLEQISELEVWLDGLKKGYKITQDGLNVIHSLKNGSFSLNSTYFASLTQVAPAIKNDPKVQQIVQYQQQIITVFDGAISWLTTQGQLSQAEMNTVKDVYANLLIDTNKDIQELNLTVSNGSLQMKDQSRVEKIDAVQKDMNGKLQFAQSFTTKACNLSLSRSLQTSNSSVLKTLTN